MLSSVLSSETADLANIRIMRAFVAMRKRISELSEQQMQIELINQSIAQMNADKQTVKPRPKIGFLPSRCSRASIPQPSLPQSTVNHMRFLPLLFTGTPTGVNREAYTREQPRHKVLLLTYVVPGSLCVRVITEHIGLLRDQLPFFMNDLVIK